MDLYFLIALLLIVYYYYRRQVSKIKVLGKKTDELLEIIKSLDAKLSNSELIDESRNAAKVAAEKEKASSYESSKPKSVVSESVIPVIKVEGKPKKPTPFESAQAIREAIIARNNAPKESNKQEDTLKPSALKGLYSDSDTKEQNPKNVPSNFTRPKGTPKTSWLESFKEKNPDLEKFIGENLINKIGILILVLGISYFVKFAIDKEWINEPARVGIGILCGSILTVIAHKLRAKYAAFSSVLVAGGISIYYFTIFIAFQEYHLFSQAVAFAIMTVITAFSTLLSVSYNRQELALLALIGGLASPFLISSGEGNYLVFFSYLIMLNIGILAVSYFKKWKIVNLVSFAATTLFFAIWLMDSLNDAVFPQRNALLIALTFYVIFSISNIINNIKSKGIFNSIERTIIIANTFMYFGLGYQILSYSGSTFLSLFTLSFAIYNILYASLLYRKLGVDKTNIYLLIGLALSFVTLAVPLQFEGNQITLFWAAEAVLLFWLSQKSKIQSYKFGALSVQILALISLVLDWNGYAYSDTSLSIVFNKLFIAGIVVVASLISSRLLLKKEESISTKYFSFKAKYARNSLGALALLTAYIIGLLEVSYQSIEYLSSNSAQAFAITYHLVFIATILFFSRHLKKGLLRKVTALISVISTLVYLVSFASLSEKEIIANLSNETDYSYAFYLHYLQILSIFYFAYVLIKEAVSLFKLNKESLKLAQWAGAATVVILISLEVSTHSLYFLSSNIPSAAIGLGQAPDQLELLYDIEPYYWDEIRELKFQIIKIAYPITWGLIAFAFLLVGIKNQWKTLRIISLSLLGLTILKLFLYDIKDVSETGKIVAFILLGVLILTISFVYQKIKKLVVDENKQDENPLP